MSSVYEFPEVYVEGVKGDYYIVKINREYHFAKNPIGEEYYGHIIYEDVIDKALDLIEAKFTRSVIVVPRYRRAESVNGLLFPKDTRICFMEIKGVQPILFIREGDEISKREKIAYIITGKGEVRVYKSLCEGIVALVVNLPWEKPEKYIVAVVSKNDAREIVIRRSKDFGV